MVDIHSHILPGLDDGARTLEDSLKMVHLAAASGTTDIVASPHANSAFPFDEQQIQRAFCNLSDQCRGVINLHLGCDFHLSYDNLCDALSNPEKYTVNHRCYLLVELPDLFAPASVREALRQLVAKRIVPIITHPERNQSLQSKLSQLEHWIEDGSLLQVTGQSLLGRFGHAAKRAARSLMSANLVHFIASDAHDCIDRPPDLSAPFDYVSSQYGARRADALFVQHPAAALLGESLANEPVKRAAFSKWLSFFRK